MTTTTTENTTTVSLSSKDAVNESAALSMYDFEDEQAAPEQQSAPAQQDAAGTQMPSEWYYADKVKGEGIPPEWFNHKTFKTVEEQAKAYSEARKQITQYAEKLKGFTGAPEEYEIDEKLKSDPYIATLMDEGKKMGLNQEGFNALIRLSGKAQELAAEKEKNQLEQYKKEQIKKIGGITKLKELEAKFAHAFGGSDNAPINWLRKIIKSHEDYAAVEKLIAAVSGNTRIPVNAASSPAMTMDQAKELIRDPRWGKDAAFTEKANKVFGYMLENAN